jgi:Flp pilus assembly protein TadB
MTQQHDAPVSITSARSSRSADIKRREVKYLVSMGVRTICFVLAVVLTGPLRWVMVAAAFLLPYFAVIIANAADGRASVGPGRFEDEDRPQLTAAPGPEPGPRASS